jgi:hypothetical protein
MPATSTQEPHGPWQKSLTLCYNPCSEGEGIREGTTSVVRVLLLQVRGQGRGLPIFLNSLKMDRYSLTMETLCAVSQRLQC